MSKTIKKHRFLILSALILLVFGGVFLFVYISRGAGLLRNTFVGGNATTTDALAGQTNASWIFAMTNDNALDAGDVIQVDFPNPSQVTPFSFTNPTVTATTSATTSIAVSVGGPNNLRIAITLLEAVSASSTIKITIDGVNNAFGRLASLTDLAWTLRTGTTTTGIPTDTLTTVKDGPATATASLIRRGGPIVSDRDSALTPSSYTASATDVSYTFTFNATTSIPSGGKIVLNFPSEFSLLNATTTTLQPDINGSGAGAPRIAAGAIATSTANGANRVILTTSNAATNTHDDITVVVEGITNPAQGVYRPFFAYTATANSGLIDGAPTPNEDSAQYNGPPPIDTVHVGGTNTINVAVYKEVGNSTTTLTAGEIAQMRVGVGCPDKQFFVGMKYLSTGATTTFNNLLDCTYMIGVDPAEGNSQTFSQNFLRPGMTQVPAIGGVTKNVTLNFGVPDATWTGTITGGVASASGVNLQTYNGQYENWMPVFTDTNYTTPGLDGSGNGYFRVRVKTGSTWKINFMGGVLSSGGNKYWPPVISSVYASSTATTSLGSFAYELANKSLSVTVKSATDGSTITSNACVGVKRTGSNFFMGAQETYCTAGGDGGSDANAYEFKVPQGDVTIEMMKPGIGKPEEFPVAVGASGATKTIYLSAPSSYITATVRDSGGTVINGAPVFAHSSNGFGQSMTNTSGQATIYVPAGTYRVEGFAPGLGPLTAQTGIVVPDGGNTSVTFTVNTGDLKTISGTVTQGGVGVPDVQVGARGYGSTSGGNGTATDSAGTYTLRVPAGTYKVGAWSQDTGGLPEQTVDVSSSNVSGVNWTLNAGGTLRIIVAGGANVSPLFGGAFDPTTGRGNGTNTWVASSTTDKYADLSLPAGTYEVHVGSPSTGELTPAGGDSVTITASQTATSTYNVSSVATMVALTGNVKDSDTNNVASANVWVSRVGGPGFYSTQTDSSGNYSLKVPDSRTYRIGVEKNGYIAANIDVEVSGATEQNFTLTTAGATITGQITSGAGALSNGWVSAKKSGSETWTDGPTDAAGNYSLAVDSGSTWTVYAEAPCYFRSSGLSAAAGTSGNNIVLTANSSCTPPTPQVTGVTASAGGMVSNGEKIKIDIPANALNGLSTGNGTVSLSISDAEMAKSSGNATPLQNSVQTITATAVNSGTEQQITGLLSAVTITLSYNESDLPPGFNEANLQFGYKDTTTGRWEPVAATVDTDLNTVTAQIDHFTDDGILLPGVPDPAQNLSASQISDSRIDLSWTGSETADWYDVYRSTTSGGTFTAIGSSTAPTVSYSSTGLAANTTYYYKITAVNENGASSYTSEASAATASGSSGATTSSGGGVSAPAAAAPVTTTATTTTATTTTTSQTPQSASQETTSSGSGKSEGTLIQYAGDPKVYVLEGGKKRWIKTAEVFNSLGYDWKKIIVVAENERYDDGADKSSAERTIGTLIKYAGDPKVYVLEGGKKRWIKTAEVFNSLGYDWKKIIIIPASEKYDDGAQKSASEKVVNEKAVVASGGKVVFAKTLSPGMKGDAIRQLQQKLKDAGYYPVDMDITGYFGKVTKDAVIKFQKANGIEQVGTVGPKTREKLNSQ